MQLHQLRYVIKVSQCRNFSIAAKELFITQPSLSQQILNLEEELGVKLFVRQCRPVTLTTAGEEFVRDAGEVLAKLDNICINMARYSSANSGILRVGVLWVWGYLGINTYLSDFQRQYSNLDVHLIPQGSLPLLEMLKGGKIDCCFIIATEDMLNDPKLYFYRLIEDKYMAIIQTGHPLCSKKVVTIRDLEEYSIILPAADSSSHNVILQAFALQNIKPHIACESTQSAITIQLVSDGIGVGFAAMATVSALQNSHYVAIPLLPEIKRDIYFVTKSDSVMLPTVNAMLKFMKHVYPCPPQ